MKILITDDSLTMRRAIKSILSMAGFTHVVEASNGQEALDRMFGVDIVLMDWNMPVMDGLTAVKAIRANPDHSDVPIIMVTTEGARETVINAMKNGVSDFVIKPVDPKVLIEKIRNLTARLDEAPAEVGQRSFTLSPETHKVINLLADKLDDEGVESRNASKLVRYSIHRLCPSSELADLEEAVKTIRSDPAWKEI